MREKMPERVDRGERKTATVENIESEEVLKHALGTGTRYAKCRNCGEAQFFRCMAGHNITDECKECGTKNKIVG